MIQRRTVLRGAVGGTAASLIAAPATAHADRTSKSGQPSRRIDRKAVVDRHAIERTASDPELPLQVGNGDIAFGADITGLQTFLPFATMSQWGWHEDPLPEGQNLDDYKGTAWDTYGRPVRYWTDEAGHPDLYNWLRGNPHRINLARIGLSLRTSTGRDATEDDLTDRHQRLDLWTGILTSRFTFDGAPVTVETACHPTLDAIAVRIDSPLIETGRLTVYVDFPYATAKGQGKFSAPFVGFWDRPDAHTTTLTPQGATRARITHRMDDTTYHAALTWNAAAGKLTRDAPGRHRYTLTGARGRRLELSCLFTPDDTRIGAPPAAAVSRAAAARWPDFWRSGGAVDLSGSRDPRWEELERRIVRSQFALAVNESGAYPPQESGLVNNGWYGKFHMEMVVWHGAHYALWNRWPLLDRSLGVYRSFLPSALERAKQQGFRGARWPKMTAPEGRDSPGLQNALLLWQMPHPIFFAELDYRAHPTRATLHKWRDIVFATADFLASYAFHDRSTGRYVLGPPVIPANEQSDPAVTKNPVMELSYWRFGLRTASAWRRRLGLAPDRRWNEVLAGLAPLPVQDGKYVLYEGVQDMWTKHTTDHPDPIAPYAMLPGDGVDVPTMRATAHQVYESWPVDDLYSWDFPVLAMNAARLGDPARAVDFLLHPKFGFTDEGLPASGKEGVPSPYFPGAGGLLYAVALMCAGWDNAPNRHAPGFPTKDWTVHWENLSRTI
ncbi:hypothetical protein ABZ801_37995 [Actinomadura sp. NPDC047616]|uniref:hypothetical protein n=1 Tax=Actinomadura sp. NPDC047616 TaxID=3155914 RepID=UPI0033D2BD0E